MSMTPEELEDIKDRANDLINHSQDEKAIRVAADVLILLTALKLEKEKK